MNWKQIFEDILKQRAGVANRQKFMEQLGKKIRFFRAARGWTQEDLAKKLGVTWETVSRWETAKVSIPPEKLKKLADTLGLPLYYFLMEVSPEDFINPKKGDIPFILEFPNKPKDLKRVVNNSLLSVEFKIKPTSSLFAVYIRPDQIENHTQIPLLEGSILICAPYTKAGEEFYKYVVVFKQNKYHIYPINNTPTKGEKVCFVSFFLIQ